jgi:2Fe-2S ferredoxin
MRAAERHGIPEIIAECGGAAACATCHVYVAPRPDLPKMSAMEDDMLEVTAEPRRPDSRLSCQIIMTADLDGLEVGLPETQV